MSFKKNLPGTTFLLPVVAGVCTLLIGVSSVDSTFGQNTISVSPLNPGSSTLERALLMPAWTGRAADGSLFGRAINGVAHQSTPLLTHDNYQYAAWYRIFAIGNSFNEHVILGRRDLNDLASGWSLLDTGLQLIHGDASDPEPGSQTQPWDNHNAINMGISGDGRLHLSYDHHGNELNYISGNAIASNWTQAGVFGAGVDTNAEVRALLQNSLTGGAPVGAVTYPRFSTNSATGNMVATYRLGGSGAGDLYISNYNASTQVWTEAREFITGNDGVLFNDGLANNSTSRNPYLNDITYSADGDLHASFTWRETANGTANHDLSYIRSTDGGLTWLNDSGDLVAGVGQSVSILSPGVMIGSDTNFVSQAVGGQSSDNPLGLIDRNQTLMNQQGQTVDANGGVHVLMWQREDPVTHDSGDRAFDTTEAAYVHFFKDPITGEWSDNHIPLFDENGSPVQVGSRPQIVYDVDANVFAAFTTPGFAADHNRNFYDPGTLVIAGATANSGYTDWSILYKDDDFETRFFEGEPLIDQQRLLTDGVLSVFIQEGRDETRLTVSDLHVFDFSIDFSSAGPLTVDFAIGADGDVQRSMLGSVELSLSAAANIGSGAFEMVKRGTGGGSVDVTSTVSGTNVVLTFSGPFTEASGSLVDGNYQLTIVGSEITNNSGIAYDLDGDGNAGGLLVFGDEESEAFYRLFGDVNQNRLVNIFDLLGFRQAYLLVTGDASFDASFDSNVDGVINFFDLLRFRQNYLKSLPFDDSSNIRSSKSLSSGTKQSGQEP